MMTEFYEAGSALDPPLFQADVENAIPAVTSRWKCCNPHAGGVNVQAWQAEIRVATDGRKKKKENTP